MAKKNIEITATHLGGKDTIFPQSYASIKRGNKARYVEFHQELKRSSVEEDVKAAYRKFFSLPQDSSNNRDLYTPQVLFEFKNDRKFANRHVRAEVQAQIIYYVHRLKFEPGEKSIPPFLCIADVDETIVTETILWESFYNNPTYDWTAAPSSPDTKLIHDLEISEAVGNMRVLHPFDLNELQFLDDFFHRVYTNAIEKSLIVKKDITERNFEDIYQSWYNKFAEDVRNGYKPSQYFICDIQEGKSYIRQDTSRVYFDIEEGISIPKKLNLKDYMAFWALYNKNRTGNVDVIRGILSKADRLSEETQRRFEGEFYTPVHLARKAIDYLDVVVGGDMKQIDWESGNYRLWDMACGTGNLEYYLPAKSYRYCYMSTLHQQDVVFCKGMFHDAKVFQYDYLNDDIDRLLGQDNTIGWKMPQELVNDLANPELKWIIFINPPFGTAQNKGKADESKRDISMTKVRDHMTINHLGEASRELFTQFLYRIHHEFKNKQAWLGLFSKLKYINANNDQKVRETIFRYHFEKGFIFDARVFDSVTGEYPIGFLVWNLNKWEKDFASQNIIVEKCNKKGEAIETKVLNVIDKRLLLNKWVNRLPATKVYPAFSSALAITQERKDLRDRISPGFLCSLCAKGNDLQNQKYVSLYSGPYCSAGAFSVTKENFLKAMIIHAVRKVAKKDWSNDRDQFCKPYNEYLHDEVVQQLGYVEGETPEFPMDFAYDCVVWSLFANSNHTVALKDVEFKGRTYQIHNNLFPFTIEQVKQWGIQDQDIAITITAEDEDRFAAKWLADNSENLSKAAADVVAAASEVYRIYFQNLNSINTNRYKIKTWGVGRYQIIYSMTDAEIGISEMNKLKEVHKKLGDKIRKRIHPLGFLR
jgi:hypothetical protein